MNKKIFLSIFLILLFSVTVNAIVVEDISEQIESGNKAVIQSNAQTAAKISALEQKIESLESQLTTIRENMLTTQHLPKLHGLINEQLDFSRVMSLIINLVCILFFFAVLFIFKAKRLL